MKRKDLITTVEKHLEEMGFTKGSWLWQPRSSQLVLLVGQSLRSITLKTAMTKRALIFEMGRIAGLMEAAGVTPRQIGTSMKNGHAAIANGAFAGMPA